MENDSQPNELSDKVIEKNVSVNNSNLYPKRIILSTGEQLVHCKVEFVLSYQVPDKHKDPEAYPHQFMFCFLRFFCYYAFYVLSLSE